MLQTNSSTARRFFHHVSGWIAYGFYYYVINRIDYEEMTLQKSFVSIPFFALIAYTVYYIFKRYFDKGRYIIGILCLLGFYLVFAGLVYGFTYGFAPMIGVLLYDTEVTFRYTEFIQNILLMLSNYSMYGVVYFFMRRDLDKAQKLHIESEEKLEALEKKYIAEQEKRQYEYVALAAQVSPHLQANLLNRWIVLLQQSHQWLAEEIEKAYELMRYYLWAHDINKPKIVSLKQEIKQLELYMELFKASDSNQTYIEWEAASHLGGFGIPATALVSLFENATKHGLTHNPQHPIRMQLHTDDTGLVFTCRNGIAGSSPYASHGVGLANLKRRLELQYGSKAQLQYGATDNVFAVRLSIEA